METSTCSLCRKVFEYNRRRGDTKDVCSSCLGNRHRYHLKWFCVQYKGGGCQLCGYNEVMRNLDFHHVDPSQKSFSLGGNHSRGWEQIRQELDKCLCVCRHCHGAIHEAEELLEWGHDTGLLERVRQVHASWTPDPTVRYSREGWQEHHPAYMRDTRRIGVTTSL